MRKLSAKINYKWGKCLQIHNKFMYESPYECKHNKLQLAKIQKYKITLQSSNFDILYLNNNRTIKNQTKTWRRKVNIHWKQWNKQWIAIQFPGLIPGNSKIQEIEKEKGKKLYLYYFIWTYCYWWNFLWKMFK